MNNTIVLKKPVESGEDAAWGITRVSIGGNEKTGYYFVYRGELKDAIEAVEKSLVEAKRLLAEREPPAQSS